MHTIITTDVLKTLTADELEDYRAAGEYYRRELTHAVMRYMQCPSEWAVNGEYRSEFGGFFPVQVRFTPSHARFDVLHSSRSTWANIFRPTISAQSSITPE